eukprot:TRINITY_DN20578_c0_g1_i1.p1 TRINITY_DN20578_c0_g1~~TRINITY_DN20578_c0_g1_i1.p1  ORF type:complete len:499 (+),score=65.86 TRINITY_DN20578_c0_g1_i1:46-1542(+)
MLLQRSLRSVRSCMSAAFQGDTKLQREYSSYLNAVDETVKYERDRKQQEQYEKGANLKMKSMTTRQKQSRQLTTEIMKAISGPDDAILKIRKVSRLFWIANDSKVPLENQYLANIAAFIMSFVKWPREEARFEKHEFLTKIYTFQKELTNAVEPELAAYTVKALASQHKNGLSYGHWTFCRGIITELKGNWTSELLSQFFRMSSRVADATNNPQLMEDALRVHQEFLTQEGYRHSGTYYCYLLSGLSKAGLIKEGLGLLHTLRGIPVSSVFATICIELCSRSDQPLAAFSMFRAAFEPRSTLIPTVECYSILLLAASKNIEGLQRDHIQFICNDMSARGVRTTDEGFLNRLCIALFAVKKDHVAMALMKNMESQGIEIWSVTNDAVPPHLRNEGTPHFVGVNVKDRAPTPRDLGHRRQRESAVSSTSDGLKLYTISQRSGQTEQKKRSEQTAKSAIRSLTNLLNEMPGVTDHETGIDDTEPKPTADGGYDVGALLGFK